MNGRSYKISVIVPVYNKKEYLRACVDSILAQNYRNMEVVLVDDASTDGSGSICDSYGKKERVKVIHQENGGPTAACVAGMQAASGDYYLFVDSDDYVEPDMVSGMASHLTGAKGEIVCCNHLLEKQKKTVPVYSAIAPGVYEKEKLETQIKARLIGQERKVIPLSRCMKLCEKSVFEGNETYYDYTIRFGDDSHMMYPAFLNSSRVVVLKDALYYHYRYVEGSIIHRYDEGIYESLQKLMASLKKAAQDKQAPDAEEALNREYCYMLLYVLKNELRNPDQGYKARIRKIFTEEENRERILNTPLYLQDRTNVLLYLGAMHPGSILVGILRLLFKAYDRRK